MVKDLLLVLLLCLCKSFQRTLSSWPSVSGVCRSSGKRVQSYTKYPFPPNILGKNCGFFSKFLKILTKQEKTNGCLIIILSKKNKGQGRERRKKRKGGRKGREEEGYPKVKRGLRLKDLRSGWTDNNQPSRFLTTAGLPAAIVSSGISRMTTEPAAMMQRLPILTPGQTITPPPNQVSSPISTGYEVSHVPRRAS